MFAVIRSEYLKKSGLPGLLSHIIMRRHPDFEERTLLGVRYICLSVQPYKGEIYWKGIEHQLSPYVRFVLLPDGMSIPRESSLCEFVPRGFCELLCLNTACEIISRTRMPLYRRVAGFIDPQCRFSGMLPQLIAQFTMIKVYCARPQMYEFACRRMLDRFGAPVIICEDLGAFHDVQLIISPGDFSTDQSVDFNAPVICGGDFHTRGRASIIRELRACLPKNLCEELPQGIDEHMMCAALYELGGCRKLSETVAEKMSCGRRRLTIDDIVDYIGRF